MSQIATIIDFNAVYYAPLRPTGSLPDRPITTTTDWEAAGWTAFEEPDGDQGAVLSVVYEMKDKRPAGTKMPTGHYILKGGAETITFQCARTDEATMVLAFPDGTVGAESIAPDGVVNYVQMVLLTDNAAYWLKKVSASGNVSIEHKNSDFAYTPFEFKCFEDSDNDSAGTTNFEIFKIEA